MSTPVSANFSREEFECKGEDCCGHSAPISKDLVGAVQRIRDYIGKPIKINSGFRCKKHNDSVGGEPYSYHTLGLACDISIPEGYTVLKLSDIIEDLHEVFGITGLGVYPQKNFIHIDVRPGNFVKFVR